MPYTIPISRLRKTDVAIAGGKGANLGQLAAAAFPVPNGFVLTTAAYDAFLDAHDLRPQISRIISPISGGDQSSYEAIAGKIRRLFQAAEIDQIIENDLLNAYVALEITSAAVRSSATVEDQSQASFAGQLESYLNISTHKGLLEAVKKCWASMWTARALAYRERMGIDHNAASMAVIIQEMVPAEVSGILFTANPNSGARDELIINASYGLGEAIVSGQVTPDTFVVKRDSLAVQESILGTKEVRIVPAAEHGTMVESVPADQASQSALSDAQLRELAMLAARVEEYFNGLPQDIEWALLGGRFWLLQARPITNLAPAPLENVRWEPLRPDSVWMRRQVVEHMPEPLSPLFDELYVQEGLDASMQALADFMSDLSGVRINIWDIIQPPFATTYNGYAYSLASFEISPKLIPFVLRIYVVVLPKMIRHLYPRWRDESLPAYRNAIARWQAVDLETTSDLDLLRGIRELAHEDAIYWFAAAVPLGLARITDSALALFLKVTAARKQFEGKSLSSGSLLRGFPSKAVEAQVQLEDIARQIRHNQDLCQVVANTPAQHLLTVLAGHPAGQEIVAAFRDYLDVYGHQIYNLDFAAPTLADDPLPALMSLKTAVEHPERDARLRQKELARQREVLTARTARELFPLLRPLFRRLLTWARRYTPVREEALFFVGAAWPAVRRLALELGRRLQDAGSLHEASDIFYLRSDEIAAGSRARNEGKGRPDLAQLAQERRQLREARRRLNPPVVVPPDGRMKFGPIDMAIFEPKQRAAGGGPVLEGFAVSPGQTTAPASVIRSTAEFDQMVLDNILVCPTTTPAWTPLFAEASGLVTDIGGALAHGSIVAREYGIPAVMGTGEATQRIKSGELIAVDGDSGKVKLLDEIDSIKNVQLPISRVRRTKEEAQASYDRLSQWYDLLAGSSERKYKEKGLSLLNVTTGETVLEIGFGTGEIIKALAHTAGPSGKVFGLDLSPGMARVTRTKLDKSGWLPEVVLTCGDAARLPYASGFFDAIYMSFTLELFDTPEIPIVLQECRRVLDEDGRIVVVAMTKKAKSGLPVKVYEWAHNNFEKYADCRPIYLTPFLEGAGFQITAGIEMSMFGLPVSVVLAGK